jgi:NAD(P)-dependent dehydrogenase (short-subunit alcohol dehydrogenase family)
MTRLTDKVAVVTGAASGIGRAIARRYVDEGAHVVLADIADDAVQKLAVELGDTACAVRCDVTVEADVAAVCELAVAQFGGLDIAVANAGRGTYGLITDHDLAEWQAIMDLCVTGVFLTIKHAGQRMRDGGTILTIASLNAVQPSAGMAAYCTAKAGVAMLTKVAAMELGTRGIRVNAIAPGLVETDATATFFQVPGIVDEFVANTTLGRFAHPDEIAGLATYLATDEASFISAGLFGIDGGAVTKRYPDLPGAFTRLTATAD